MEQEIVTGDTQMPAETPVETPVQDDLVEKNKELFARAKKAEEELKTLKALPKDGETEKFDSASLEKRIEEKVDLRVAGHSPEEIAEIEAYAKGRGISLSEAAKSPFITKAVEGLRAEKKSTDSTPAPTRVPTFNGKPVDEILKTGTPAEKQAAFEARMRGGVKSE